MVWADIAAEACHTGEVQGAEYGIILAVQAVDLTDAGGKTTLLQQRKQTAEDSRFADSRGSGKQNNMTWRGRTSFGVKFR